MRILIVIATFVFSLVYPDLKAQSIDSCYIKAMESYYNINYDDAYNQMYVCYQADTTNREYVEKLALFSFRKGENRLAKKWNHKVLELDSTNIIAFHYLGQLYEQEDYLPKALKYYSKLIKQDSTNSIFWKKTGAIYMKAGLAGEGIKYYEKAHSLNRNDIGVIKTLTEYYLSNNQEEEAENLLEYGLQQDPENIGLIQLAAKKDYKLGNYADASLKLYGLTRKVDLDPYYNKMLGYSFLQIDSIDKAIFHLEKALTKDKKPESVHYYLGNAYQKKKDLIYAKHHYEKAIDAGISDNLGIYYKQLAGVFEKDKDYKLAIKYYKKAYEFSSDDELLYMLALNCDLYYKDKRSAINYYSKYASSDHQNSAYKKYAIERMRYLREVAHFSEK
jgi:tetratricopeptide (TPR) repeat protein